MLKYKKIAVLSGAVGISLFVYALSPFNNLVTWENSPNSEREKFCKVMVSKLKQPGLSAQSLCACISDKASGRWSRFLNISEAANICAASLK